MQPEAPAHKPRRERHLVRWIFIGILAILGWFNWKAHDFRNAVKEAKELGWTFYYKDPIALIRADWRDAFRKETWSDTERELYIRTKAVSERDFDLIRRLKPKKLLIYASFPWRDLSQLKGLSNLTELYFGDCPNLTNIDALKDMRGLTALVIRGSPVLVNINALKELKSLTRLDLSRCAALTNVDALRELKALKLLGLYGCAGLKNVDGILGLTDLEELYLKGCDGLPKEAVDAVIAALPKTNFTLFYDL